MAIKLLTLKTNHTIMGEIENKGDYEIKQPVQVVIQPTKDGPTIGFLPFVEFAKEFKTGFRISASDVLFESTPIVELENQYNKLFGSGIEIASVIPKM